MKRWVAGSLCVGLLVTGCTDDDGDGAATPTSPPASTSETAGAGTLEAGWTAQVTSPFGPDLPNKGANPIAVGDVVVVLEEQQATGLDVVTGESLWETELPESVCASSRQAGPDGVVGVLLGTDGDCVQAAALDVDDGSLLWTVLIPGAADSFGHQVAVGSASVVVSGECTGFTVLAIADGSVVTTVTGENVKRQCATAASDGTTAVLASDDTISTYDAATGAPQDSWPAPGLGRLGDVLSTDPLVVSGRFEDGGFLIDLSGSKPTQFGRDGGGFGGEPAAAVRSGHTLWVQYDDEDELVGYDLASHQEVGTVPVGDAARLVGVHDDRLVVTVGDVSPDGVEVWLVDPASPTAPEALGLLARPDGEQGGLVGSVVADDAVVRLWSGQVQAYPLS